MSKADLKFWLQRLSSRQDKLLIVLAHTGTPTNVLRIKELARECGLRITKTWNPSTTLRRATGLAILITGGWEITEAGKQHLRDLGVSGVSPSAAQIAVDLRAYLVAVSDPQTRAFIEEAIKCYELGLHRSAVVMSWLGAVYVLQRDVVANHLADFNKEVARVDPKWKPAKTTDDIGRIKESDFLDRLNALSVIGKNAKLELQQCLSLRNGCGHPSSLKLGANTVARHLELLLLNVFQQFK